MPTVRKKLEHLPEFSENLIDKITAIPDEKIDDGDIPELDAEFWKMRIGRTG